MSDATTIRPQGMWFAHELAKTSGKPVDEVCAALVQLIERGHLKILNDAGPGGIDLFEMVTKDPPP